eukprot:TRINITY_DN11405_c0_g1_i1.p2 TRINITY_DN11405_c0_g1~~TRINITY_DN11405_c0_g1_i1.p2  ORF type:complete len:352 (+),score=54.29 TRINITY_DN11405_c0_g1_i1:244-1299(+)
MATWPVDKVDDNVLAAYTALGPEVLRPIARYINVPSPSPQEIADCQARIASKVAKDPPAYICLPPRAWTPDDVIQHMRYRERLNQQRRIPLILDLDLTLVHCTMDAAKAAAVGAHFFVMDLPNGKREVWYFRWRPYVVEFLQRMAPIADIILYTFGVRQYADSLMSVLTSVMGGNMPISRVVGRDNCNDKLRKAMTELFPASQHVPASAAAAAGLGGAPSAPGNPPSVWCDGDGVVVDDNDNNVWRDNSCLLRIPPYDGFPRHPQPPGTPPDDHLRRVGDLVVTLHRAYFDLRARGQMVSLRECMAGLRMASRRTLTAQELNDLWPPRDRHHKSRRDRDRREQRVKAPGMF